MNYKVGDEIVAIRNHSQGAFKIGDIFICKDIIPAKCGCKKKLVDIGHKNSNKYSRCTKCNHNRINNNNTHYFSDYNFIKLDSISISEALEVLEGGFIFQ